ncbi:MAG: DUF3822 family protein [Marinifilaceae bacterium]|jgi:hypothetical protein|nr:DUF3822 family protein [Marinifilaceae bacterium]
MNDFIYLDSNFDKNKSKQYKLSIRVSTDGYCFLISHGLNCLAISHFTKFEEANKDKGFEQYFDSNQYINLSFKKINIFWQSNKISFIPKVHVQQIKLEYLFSTCHQFSDELDELKLAEVNDEILAVYSIPTKFKEFFEKKFGKISIRHNAEEFYKYAINTKQNPDSKTVFVLIQESCFFVAIPNNEKKHYMNSYEFNFENDIIYYILNIYKSLNIDPKSSKLIIEGNVQTYSRLASTLNQYLSNVEVVSIPKKYQANAKESNLELNSLVNLIRNDKCE